jgi:[ribosomal protein S5]-alanine N-acetyltransferase
MEIKLRKWELTDLEDLVRLANNPKIASNLTDGFPHPYTTEKGNAFLQMAQQNSPATLFAIEFNGVLAGGIGIHPQMDIYRKNGELGYWIGEPFWGKGLATSAIVQMVNYVFENFEIERIFARPFGRNIGSQKVLEKSGFILEAKFEKTIFKSGVFEDEWIYGLRR